MSRRQREPGNVFYRKGDPNPPLFPDPWEGDIYYNTTSNRLRIFTDGAWSDVQGGEGGGGSSFGVNIKDYGAIGDGTTDDTAAINNAITALGANGGRLLVPAGNYRVEGTINLVDGLVIQGESSRRSRFYKPNDGNLLVGVDTDRFTLRDIFLVGPGQGVGNGNALTITRSSLDALTAIDLLQVNITSFGGDGIDIDGPLANTFDRVYVTAVGGTGIYLHHSGTGGATSSTLSNCFVAGAATGFWFDESNYMALLGCASDDTTTAYRMTTCFAMSMVGCGAEIATNAIRLEQACRGISIESFYMLGMTGSGIYTNDAQVFLTGLYEEPGSGTYSVEATGPGTVKYINCTITKPMTGNVEAIAVGDFVPQTGGAFTGDLTIASQALVVRNPSGTAEFIMDRPNTSSIGQVVFRTNGANDGWALTHLNSSGNFRIWNFSQGANAMTFDAAGTYINAHNKRITNVTDPVSDQDAATKGYTDSAIANLANIGTWCETSQSVSGNSSEVTASFSSFSTVRPGGWTLSGGAVIVPFTGNYLMINRYRITPSQVQIWVGHEGYSNPVLNMSDADGAEQWMTYSYMLRLSAGAAVPRPVLYGAGGGAWTGDIFQSVTYTGSA